MMFKTAAAAGILAISALVATAPVGAARPANATYIGNYGTLEACQADGKSPTTGGNQGECEQRDDGTWDLYTF
ncbi:hypothetical protein [Nocardia altamirensis]|uniref:hypothetical protein n=1 Tax=Nocardia altamirensis TaxID=472158 RepID=UPI00084072E5|nr:hypothetical protein [Nocardia altamirensis]